jgi:fibronectin type 3 domain-containing protein
MKLSTPWLLIGLILLVWQVNAQPPLRTAQSLTALSSAKNITLSWQLPKGQPIIRVRLYRQMQSQKVPSAGRTTVVHGGELLATLEPQQTNYVDEFVEPGKRYLYRIKLFGKGNVSSTWSLPALAMLRDEQAPAAIANLQFSAPDDARLQLSWSASASPDVESYHVYRAMPKASPVIVARIAAQKGRHQRAILAQTPNTEVTFQYRVAAMDVAGNVSTLSGPVAVRLADRVAPRAPLQLRISQLDQRLQLDWLENSEDDLAGYRVYRKDETAAGSWQQLNAKPLDINQFSDDDFAAHRSYRYRVTALDRYGNESRLGKGQRVRTVGFRQALLAPQAVSIHKTRTGFAQLQWRLKQNKGIKLAGVIVERSDGGEFSAVSNLIKQLSFTDTTVRRGMAYQYRLQALGIDGKASVFSERVVWKGGRQ